MALGFSFNGISANTYNLIARSVDRPILPALRKREIIIPGRHGSYDFEGNVYENRIIEIDVKWIASSADNLRATARSIASWLSQTERKQLIFDDEPAKYYLAKLYSAAPLQNLLTVGQTSLIFECDPFAYSTTVGSFSTEITEDDQEFTVTTSGTAETPQIITVTNTGGTTIVGFSITRTEES